MLARQLQAEHDFAPRGSNGDQSQVEHLFRLEFDQTSGIPPCWVDTKTLNFFNTLRDNIFASSSHHDRLMLQPRSQTPTDQKNKKKKPEGASLVVDKSSVAFQRGKRSCTQLDSKNYKDGGTMSIMNQLRQHHGSQGKRSVGPSSLSKASPHPKGALPTSLTQQADKVASEGGEHSYQDYDYCHHCKQLKHQCLLVQCKYSSRQCRQPGVPFAPYPYEPQFNTVNNIKIYNADLQNKS